jgi:transposase-like protein
VGRGCCVDGSGAGVGETSGGHQVEVRTVVTACRLPLPASGDRRGGALVAPVRPSYRDVEELLAGRGIEVDHVTVYRWVQTFTPEFIDAARPARHSAGDRWFLDETYVKVAGRWTHLYRAVDQYGQVIDVVVCERRDAAAARVFFARALAFGLSPVEITTDRAPVDRRVIAELAPAARHVLGISSPARCDAARLGWRL